MPKIEAEIQKKLKQATGHDWVCQLWDYIFIWLTTSKKEIIPEIPRIPGNNQEYKQYPENPTGHCLSATSFNRTKVYIFPDVCSILISCHWIEAAQHPPTPPVPSLQKIQFSLPHSQTRCLFTSILKKYNTRYNTCSRSCYKDILLTQLRLKKNIYLFKTLNQLPRVLLVCSPTSSSLSHLIFPLLSPKWVFFKSIWRILWIKYFLWLFPTSSWVFVSLLF